MSKRQRHVFPNRELPHLWAHQTQDEARNGTGSFYFRGAYRELRPYHPASLWHANRRSSRCTLSCWQAHRSLKTGCLCLVQSSSASKCREFVSRKNPLLISKSLVV